MLDISSCFCLLPCICIAWIFSSYEINHNHNNTLIYCCYLLESSSFMHLLSIFELKLVRAQVLEVLGSYLAAVYWLLGRCATGVLRPACKLRATWRGNCSLSLSCRSSPQTERVIRPSDFNQHFKHHENPGCTTWYVFCVLVHFMTKGFGLKAKRVYWLLN